MTDCPNGEMRDLLPELLHERLAPAERALVVAHVAACADCRDELALLAGMRASLQRAPAVDVGAIVRALPAYRAPAQAPARRAWGGWRAAAAIAAITIGGASVAIVRQGGESMATQPASVASSARVAPVVPAAPVAVATSEPASAPAAARPRELAVAGAVSDLSDGELAALLADIETIDAVPATAAEVEAGSLAPASAAASARGAS